MKYFTAITKINESSQLCNGLCICHAVDLKDEARAHKPGHVEGFLKLEKARNWNLPLMSPEEI